MSLQNASRRESSRRNGASNRNLTWLIGVTVRSVGADRIHSAEYRSCSDTSDGDNGERRSTVMVRDLCTLLSTVVEVPAPFALSSAGSCSSGQFTAALDEYGQI